MSGVVQAMESALRSMNLEKVQNLMDRFEKDFENLDVQSATMEGSMTATTTLNAPQAQVNALIQEAADKAGYVYYASFSRIGRWQYSFCLPPRICPQRFEPDLECAFEVYCFSVHGRDLCFWFLFFFF